MKNITKYLISLFIFSQLYAQQPELITPVNDSTITMIPFEFEWQFVLDNAGWVYLHRLQIDDDPDFSSPIYDNNDIPKGTKIGNLTYVASLTCNLPLLDKTKYYWRVRTYISVFFPPPFWWSDWSDVWSFTTDYNIQASASDGEYDHIRVTWENIPEFISDVSISRDDFSPATIAATEPYYQDDPESPGILHNYTIEFLDDENNVRSTIEDIGFEKANGNITGTVTTQGGSNVSGVIISATPNPNNIFRALEFDGINDYVSIPNSESLNPTSEMTIEVWVKSEVFNRDSWQQFVAKGGDPPNTAQPRQFGLRPAINTGIPYFYIHDTNDQPYTVGADTSLINGQWNHVAATYDNSELKIYVNGELKGVQSIGAVTVQNSTDPLAIGRLGSWDAQYFQGLINDVRFWNIARSDSTIHTDMFRILRGDEEGLVAWWNFDAGSGDIAGDYAVGGGHHGTIHGAQFTEQDLPDLSYQDLTDDAGYFDLYRVFYDYQSETYFDIIPSKAGHVFDPIAETRRIYSESAVEVNFTDASSFTVSGQVFFAGTSCGLDSVTLTRDGEFCAATVDSNGNFFLTIEEPGEYTIAPRYRDHEYIPADTTINVDNDVSGIVFIDTTTHILSGTVAGGQCTYDIGQATINISSPRGCFFTSTQTTNSNYNLRLPALPELSVTVTTISGETGDLIFNQHKGFFIATQNVNLAAGDRIADFIYYAEPEIRLSGFPETLCSVPVMQQATSETVYIQVVERYLDNYCPVDSGGVVLINEISIDPTPKELILNAGGSAADSFVVSDPNIYPLGLHPYQKRMHVTATTRGGETTSEAWVIVTGNRPREQTFTTVSPEIPLLILRDPPGDASYSYLEQATTSSFSTSMSALADASIDRYKEWKVGAKFSGGVFVTTETHIWGSLGTSLEIGSSMLSQTEQQLIITTSNEFATSGNEEVTGTEGDVFVGAALNIIYALTDVLEVNENCQVEISQSVIYGSEGFATTYIYTEDFIRNSLLPDLERLRDLSTDFDDRQNYSDQIDVWYQTLALNERLKEEAQPLGSVYNNISFSGQASFENSTTVTQTISSTIDLNLYINTNVAREGGFEIAGSGYKRGVQVKTRYNLGSSITTGTSHTNTVGFYLSDGDQGDYFSVDVLGDPTYGTPVFKLISGASSCPWEPGTLPREGVMLAAASDIYEQHNIDPAAPATFILQLYNDSQSDETRDYELRVLHQTNPDGAVIRVNGVSMADALDFTIGGGETVEATMIIKRGPIAYDYDNIRLVLRSPCDNQIADTAAFSVHYECPCSPVSISGPAANWIVNSLAGDSLQVRFDNYDRSTLDSIVLQYLVVGGYQWRRAFTIPALSLPEINATFYWDISDVDDGRYALRAAVYCTNGIGYSATVRGLIDRIPPRLAGQAEPTDGVLGPADEIAASFDDTLYCPSVSADNVLVIKRSDGSIIPANVSCLAKRLLINPTVDNATIENQTLQVSVSGIEDNHGNALTDPLNWSFLVNRNPVHWMQDNIHLTIYEHENVDLIVKLKNEGASTVFFSLTDIPAWLGVTSAHDGWIAAGAELPLNCSLSPFLEQGVYEDVLVADTPEGEEILPITLNVQAQPPVWSFDTFSYPDSMTVTAGFYIGDTPFSEENDLVAAFAGDSLCGLARVQQVFPQNEYISFLVVYGYRDQGEMISFRIWDASEGEIRTISESLLFVADNSYGSMNEPDSLHVSGAVLQSLALKNDWTWISLGTKAADMSTGTVLSHLPATAGDLIKSHDAYCQYLPGTGWVGTLDTLRFGNSFKINLANAAVLDFIGNMISPTDHPVDVGFGWNWIAYLPAAPLLIGEALSSLNPVDEDRIKGQHLDAVYNQGEWQGDLQTMEPGRGYMLHLQNDGVLTYPQSSGKSIPLAKGVHAANLIYSAPNWNVNPNDYEFTMNMTGILEIDGIPVSDGNTLLAAFVSDECRGVAMPLYVADSWFFFLTIYSNDITKQIYFKTWDAAEDAIKDIVQTKVFADDGIFGSPSRPFVWDTGVPSSMDEKYSTIPTEFALEHNYPNPFNPKTTIRYALKQPEHVHIIVYDMLGKKVKDLVDIPQLAGWYEVDFNASNLASGVYFYKLVAGPFTSIRKMILIK